MFLVFLIQQQVLSAMELKLSLPSYPPASKAEVEMRPKQVQAWLEALPLANGQEAGRKLADAIIALGSIKLAEDTRCQLLELYRDTVCKLLPSLQQLYAGKSLPLGEKSLQAATLARELLQALANGYKLALMDLSARRANLAVNKTTPLAMARAITCLGGVSDVYYDSYVPVPAALWSELHRLYWYAAKLQIHDAAIAEKNADSVNAAYQQVLLLALADPYRLSQAQLQVVRLYLAQFGGPALLQPMGPTENKHGLFLVRLDGDKPPKALMHYQGVTDARSDIILNTIPLARLAHQHLQQLDAGETPAKLGLPQVASTSTLRDLLKRLIKQWGVAPKRMFNRIDTEADARICGGISAVHHILSQGPAAELSEEPMGDQVTVEVSDALHATGSQSTFNCARWIVLNESAGGVSLAKDPSSFTKIKVGDVIGVEAPQTETWGVGLVRWMRSAGEGKVELGAQLLAPDAQAVAIKPVITSANALFQPALLLPEIPRLKQAAHMIASRGSYQPMREFEVRSQGLIHLVRADKLIEQTDSVDLFTFS